MTKSKTIGGVTITASGIKKAREAKGLTQADLAAKMDVCTRHVQRWERFGKVRQCYHNDLVRVLKPKAAKKASK